ncbi:MAG: 30S ribosome-binding factor RbfA [Nitrospiraceae bacterium]|nr:30S ribosome-binding factor RbfA [Nitrospiraceae bacterium]
MAHGVPRSKRIADLLKEEMAHMLLSEIKDPRVHGLVSVIDVEVSDDLRKAVFFFSVFGDAAEQKSVLKGLNSAKGFIRHSLGQRIGLRWTPEIQFELDRTLDEQERIEKLLAKI